MNRAFLSLYFFIVMSVILIGWGLDKFWETLTPTNELSSEIIDLVLVVEDQLHKLSESERASKVASLQEKMRYSIALIALDDLANTSVGVDIYAGKIIPVSATDKPVSWYKRLGKTQSVLVITAPVVSDKHSVIYSSLIILFYLAIALAIFFWMWPLSRDLGKLEKQTRHVGKDGILPPLMIAPSSTVYPLANAFNKMAQRIRELISSHREMTYAVSHELRTPLARMKFALAMAESPTANPAQQHQSLASLRQDILEMEDLISSLLMYAGFEQSTAKLDCRDGDIKGLFDDVLGRLHRNSSSQLKISLVDNSDNAIFNCEWKLMETVIQNLLLNAARFAQLQIEVELMANEQEFQIAIADDGPGIAPEDRERVLDSFIRLYNENTQQTGGFGLGLAIVRRIIRWHGGEVVITDSKWGGAKVLLRWPKCS